MQLDEDFVTGEEFFGAEAEPEPSDDDYVDDDGLSDGEELAMSLLTAVEPEDTRPPPRPPPRNSQSTRNEDQLPWQKKTPKNRDPWNPARTGPLPSALCLAESDDQNSALKWLQLLIDDSVWATWVIETNRYAQDKNAGSGFMTWTPVTKEDLYNFFSILILMSLNRRSDTSTYWSTKWGMKATVPEIMSRNRFQQIKKYFHTQPNYLREQNNPFWKLSDFIRKLTSTFKKHFYPRQNVCVDEAVAPFKGRHKKKVRIRGKPHPVGWKVFCLCDSETGYIYNFVMDGDPNLIIPNGLGRSDGPVAFLSIPLRTDHTMFVDNYFTSYGLAWYLLEEKRIALIGTLRKGRSHLPKELLLSAAQQRALAPGAILHSYCHNNFGLTQLWKDNRCVLILSTATEANDIIQIRRRRPSTAAGRRRGGFQEEVEERTAPKAIELYNKNMGGVDLFGQLQGYFKIGRKSTKWWHSLFFWLFNAAVTQAWILHKEACRAIGESFLSHREFVRTLAEDLHREANKFRKKSAPKKLRSDKQFSMDPPDCSCANPHERKLLSPNPTKRRRLQCRISNCTGLTKRYCGSCETPLCKRHMEEHESLMHH
jgi:DNA excision repair protein ERCC-6